MPKTVRYVVRLSGNAGFAWGGDRSGKFTYVLGGPAPDVGNESAKTCSTGSVWTTTNVLDGLHVRDMLEPPCKE